MRRLFGGAQADRVSGSSFLYSPFLVASLGVALRCVSVAPPPLFLCFPLYSSPAPFGYRADPPPRRSQVLARGVLSAGFVLGAKRAHVRLWITGFNDDWSLRRLHLVPGCLYL